MSIIAWDGKTLAVDMQGSCGDLVITLRKTRKLQNGIILAWTGDQEQGLALARWYMDGAYADKWPEFQKEEHWTQLVVVNGISVFFYEKEPELQKVHDPFMAWGSGRDIAIGVLAMGGSAEKAVEITSKFNIHCGLGCEVFQLIP